MESDKDIFFYNPRVSVHPLTIRIGCGRGGLKETYLQLIYVRRTDVQDDLHIALLLVVARRHVFNKLLHMSLHVDVDPGPLPAPRLKWGAPPPVAVAALPEEVIANVGAEQLQRELGVQVAKEVVAVLATPQLPVQGQLCG